MSDYADHLESLWNREADLADDAADAGVTPEELLAQRAEDAADSVRDGQRDKDDERAMNPSK